MKTRHKFILLFSFLLFVNASFAQPSENILVSPKGDTIAIKPIPLLEINSKIGDIEGGDFAVKYNGLDTGIQKMAADINIELGKIAAAINAIVPCAYTPTPIAPDISTSKVDKIELP